MSYRLVRHENPARLLEVAEPFLAEEETLRGMTWGLARLNRIDPAAHGGVASTWSLQRASDATVVGAFFWSPPKRDLVMTDVPADAGPALLDGLRDVLAPDADPRIPGWRIPGWHGTEAAVTTLSEAWSAAGRGPVETRMRLLLYRCERITRQLDVAGRLRQASEEDRELCIEWAHHFCLDTGLAQPNDEPPRVLPQLDAGRLFLWEVDGRPVACATWSRPTPHSASIGFVYVPDALRGRHYASAITAALTRHLLEKEGKTFTTLFTLAENATTNHLYPALGYRFVAKFLEAGPV